LEIKLTKHILGRLQKLHKNIEENERYANEINEWLKKFDMEFNSNMELIYSKIVKGEVIEKNGKEYLKVEGKTLAESNRDGTFVHQVNDYEDSFHGEFYFRVDNERFLQIFYDC